MNFKKLKQHISYALLIVALAFAQTEANAQIKKGQFQIGGTASFLNNNVETTFNTGNPQSPTTVLNTKNNNASFGPAFGYFVSDNFSLGIQLGYGTNGAENNDFNSTLNSFQYGVYGRWHKPIIEKFYFFTSLSLLIGNGVNETLNTNTGQTEKADISTFNSIIAPGIIYFVTDWLSFETSVNMINYGRTQAEAQDNSFSQNTENFNLNLNLTNLNLGVVFYF